MHITFSPEIFLKIQTKAREQNMSVISYIKALVKAHAETL